MIKDNRKAKRRPIRYTAWLVLAADRRQVCALWDISETGARIAVEDSSALPEHFPLWLSANGSARRTCRVIWRKPKQIGVMFEQRLADADRATLVPRTASDIEEADGDVIAADMVENDA
jgi:PilZ domain